MSVPAALPIHAVRRIVCADCERLCEAAHVAEVRPGLGERFRALVPRRAGASLPSVSTPSPPAGIRADPRWLTLPIAALAVFGILSLLNGRSEPAPPAADPVAVAKPENAPAAKADPRAGRANAPAKAALPADAQLVAESTFSLALPAGWDRVKPAAGATFAAVSADGAADATLWIQNDPKLDFAAFEANSLEQLETLTGSARVVERKVGPAVESSSVTLAPEHPPGGSPTYEVVLRAAGDNWYYLATTSQAGAPAKAIEGVELLQGSFLPLGGKP